MSLPRPDSRFPQCFSFTCETRWRVVPGEPGKKLYAVLPQLLRPWQWGSTAYWYFHFLLHRGTELFMANTTRKNKTTPEQTTNETLLLSLQWFNLHSESRQRGEGSDTGWLLPAARESGRRPWCCDGFYLMKINNTPSSQMCCPIWIFIFTVNGTRSEYLQWGSN